MEISIAVKGMSCGGCEKAIERALLTRDGVLKARASHREAQVRIEFDPKRIGETQLRQAIEGAGYHVP
jgi:copper chaperone